MKRRELFKLVPLTAVGMNANSGKASGSPEPRMSGRPEPLAIGYLNKITEMLTWTRKIQAENLLQAAEAVARTVDSGRTCWTCWDQGHSRIAEMFPGRNGDPGILKDTYDPEKSKKGDCIMISYPFGIENLDDLKKKGITIIAAPSPVSGDCINWEDNTPQVQKNKWKPYADIWIQTQVTSVGALMKVPGSPALLGPASGSLYIPLMWMIVADACRLLSKSGKKFKVKGDEPVLSGTTVPWIDLERPVMFDYFDTVIRQIEFLGSELGDMRAMAGLIVDTLIAHKSAYFYGRYPGTFCSEATGRRGGFGFPKAAQDGTINGESGDVVVMGITKPDDERDLANLDEFRRRGMKVCSIGPMTRDRSIPEGKTVPKEADVHFGRVFDTYGMFAMPGFDQKVCPTSGALYVTALWAMSMEIAEQMIARTRNTPGIHFSGSLKWGGDYNAQMRAMVTERGY